MLKCDMENFEYRNKCEILFGQLPEGDVATALKRHGAKNVLIVFGSDRIKESGLFGKITDGIKFEGIKFTEFGGVVANPSLKHANEGVEIARKNKVDFVLAIGGGSVIDAAKFIAVGAAGGNAEKIFKGDTDGVKAIPMAAVLTLPAAGSEASNSSVIRDDISGEKISLTAECIRPRFAFINPTYCMTLPKEQIAYGASDIFAHLLERYFCPQDNIVFTDKLLEGAMKAMLEIAPKLYNDPSDYQLWAEFCLIGTIAHNSMLSMGRVIQDWGVHNIENKLLSGIQNIAHGAGLAILFPAWMKHVSKTKPQKIQQFTREVIGIDELQKFYRGLGLAQTLSELNIDAEIVKRDATKIYPQGTILGGYGQIGVGDILEIINICAR